MFAPGFSRPNANYLCWFPSTCIYWTVWCKSPKSNPLVILFVTRHLCILLSSFGHELRQNLVRPFPKPLSTATKLRTHLGIELSERPDTPKLRTSSRATTSCYSGACAGIQPLPTSRIAVSLPPSAPPPALPQYGLAHLVPPHALATQIRMACKRCRHRHHPSPHPHLHATRTTRTTTTCLSLSLSLSLIFTHDAMRMTTTSHHPHLCRPSLHTRCRCLALTLALVTSSPTSKSPLHMRRRWRRLIPASSSPDHGAWPSSRPHPPPPSLHAQQRC